MRSKTTALLVLTGIVILSLAVAGCTGNKIPGDPEMADIDAKLQNGPVLVEFGASWCHWCELEKPVLESLSRNYTGVAYISVDINENNELADAFYSDYVPQISLIVKKNPDGSYLYIDPEGNVNTDRFKSRIVGFRKYDELKPLLEAVLAAR